MTINRDLVGRTLDRIIANPNEWDQEAYCGTTFCYAGHALLAEGYQVNEWGSFIDENGDGLWSVERTARDLLGFDEGMVDRIFHYFPHRNREGGHISKGVALRLMIDRVAEVTGIDPEPYLAKVADLP